MRILALLLTVLCLAPPLYAQQLTGRTMTVGATPTTPSGSTVRITGLGSSGGTGVIFTDAEGDMIKRTLTRSDLPAEVAYEDEANTFALLQTLTSGFVANGASTVNATFTIGGANDLVLGTGGLRVPSGCVNVRNVADSATIAAFCDSSVALNQNTTVTGTFTGSGAGLFQSTFTVNGAADFDSTVNIDGLTTAAKIRTTGVYGVTEPFTVFATDATTQRLLIANAGNAALTDTGTDSYLRFGASGAPTGQRNWRIGIIGSNFGMQGGDDAGTTWTNLMRMTQDSGTPNGWYWGTGMMTVSPDQNYQTNLGEINLKYANVHGANLWFDNLVVQNTIATIGGNIMVTPSTTLKADLPAAGTTIYVEHNEMEVNDVVLMRENGQTEFMQITAGPVAVGGGGSGTPSIAYVSSLSGAGSTVTLPSYSIGDLIVVVAVRNGSTTAPTLPTGQGWTASCTGGGNSTSYTIGWKIADSLSETTGSWSSTTIWHALVYSGATGLGDCAASSAAASTTLTYPLIELTNTDGSSWVTAIGYSTASLDVDDVGLAGYTFRLRSGTATELASFDTNGPVSVDQPSTPVTLGTPSNTRGMRFEILGTIIGGGGGTATGYEYGVTRGYGGVFVARDWYAGDGVVNTGVAGDGHIDIYSIQSVKGSGEAGPTIAGNVRTSTVYNAWSTRWALGNLRNLYANGAVDIFGLAAGDNSDVYFQVDATHGARFFEGGTNLKLQIHPSGYIQIGQSGSGQLNTYIDNAQLLLREGVTSWVQLTAAGLLSGLDASGFGNIFANVAGDLSVRSGLVPRLTLSASNGAFSLIDDDGATVRAQINATEAVFGSLAGARVQVDYAAAAIRMFDTSGNRTFYADGSNGVIIGKTHTSAGALIANTPYLHASPTALSLCNTNGGGTCSLSLNGTTGDFSLVGDIFLSGGGNIESVGNFSLTNTTGLTFAVSTSPTGDASRAVNFGGGSKLYELGTGLVMSAAGNMTLTGGGLNMLFVGGTTDEVAIVNTAGGVTLRGSASGGNIARIGTSTAPWTQAYISEAIYVPVSGTYTAGYTGAMYMTDVYGVACQANVVGGVIVNHNCTL